jgi:L-lactate utilization protein LutC
LEIKNKLTKSCIFNVAVCGSETWTIGKNEERVINAFETWCWRRMLKIKWTARITNDEVFQTAREQVTFKNVTKYTPLMDEAYN